MKKLFILMILLSGINLTKAQPYASISANDIRFIYENDDATRTYNLKIVLHNSSTQPVMIYEYLTKGGYQGRFGNIFIKLEKEVNGVYQEGFLYFSNSGILEKAYPMNFDIERIQLAPNASKTFEYSSQDNPEIFKIIDPDPNITPTRYRIQIFFRIGFASANPSAIKPNTIVYKESDWFYFKPKP